MASSSKSLFVNKNLGILALYKYLFAKKKLEIKVMGYYCQDLMVFSKSFERIFLV